MAPENEPVAISALQHYVFCPRQCALIHIEQSWIENALTAEGRVMHERAHAETIENRKTVRIERNVPLWSDRLGLTGRSDVIEFRRYADTVTVYPLEFKHGKPKQDQCDSVQLCAQALCLEEMLGATISSGAFFYGKTRHRLEIAFDSALRAETARVIEETRAFLLAGKTPKPDYTKQCESCSFIEDCMPRTFSKTKDVAKYIANQVKQS